MGIPATLVHPLPQVLCEVAIPSSIPGPEIFCQHWPLFFKFSRWGTAEARPDEALDSTLKESHEPVGSAGRAGIGAQALTDLPFLEDLAGLGFEALEELARPFAQGLVFATEGLAGQHPAKPRIAFSEYQLEFVAITVEVVVLIIY